MRKKQIRNDYGTVRVPVDDAQIDEVSSAIGNLTCPMESGVKEKLSVDQVARLALVTRILNEWIEEHKE